MNTICPEHQHCPGCQLWQINPTEEKQIKLNSLAEKLQYSIQDITYIEPLNSDYRDRMDFAFSQGQMGLFKFNEISLKKELIPLNNCAVLNSDLKPAFEVLKNSVPQFIQKGSLRMRRKTSTLSSAECNEKKYGLWLDFANQDIKTLLDEKNILNHWRNFFEIEIGQKKKKLSPDLKLRESFASNWFSTFISKPVIQTQQNQFTNSNIKPQSKVLISDFKLIEIPLYCHISSFTQPSAETAGLLVKQILLSMKNLNIHTLWEFGCGLGQYTIPLLAMNYFVEAFEIDTSALDCLNLSLEKNDLSHLKNNLIIHHGDFQNQIVQNNAKKTDAVLVNPPKSGLKQFADSILNIQPQYIIYISCFAETLAKDCQKFKEQGYKMKSVHLVNQFKHTHHFESLVVLEK